MPSTATTVPTDPWIVEVLAEHVRPGDTLVDVGCGSAPYRGLTPAHYIGIDNTAEDYAPGRPRDVDIVSEAADLAVAGGSADVVLMVGALYQFPDPAQALREAHRILRPGGTLLLFDYNRRTQRRLARAEGAPRPCWTALGLRRRVRDAGFSSARLLLPSTPDASGLRLAIHALREELRGQRAAVLAVK
jgi:SAM-dependent methyltransferase